MECDIAQLHVQSYDYLCDHGLTRMALDVIPEKFRISSTKQAVEIRVLDATLNKPQQPLFMANSFGGNSKSSIHDGGSIFPSECRQRRLSYVGKLQCQVQVRLDGRGQDPITVTAGTVPIMLQSSKCHLRGLSEQMLIKNGEEPTEKGGYYVVNGSEKVVRNLVNTRRNYPIALRRSRYCDRGPLYTDNAITMRCVKDNHQVCLMFMHYLENGSIMLCFVFGRSTFFVPIVYVLKALSGYTDRQVYNALMSGREHDNAWRECVINMLNMANEDGVTNQQLALEILGKRFRVLIQQRVGPWESNIECGRFMLRNAVCVHLRSDINKFYCLVYASQKLIAFVNNEILEENPDNIQFQETAMSGHIMLMLLKERLEVWLSRVRRNVESIAKRKGERGSLTPVDIEKAFANTSHEFTRSLEGFLATGNLPSISGLGMPQQNGFSVIAERINHLRFVSHFRAIHRGSFFTTMRTTDVRKLRPEAWGFICPVHTPDGSPCGLLNHLTASCRAVTTVSNPKKLIQLMRMNGVLKVGARTLVHWPHGLSEGGKPPSAHAPSPYPVYVDGMFVGHIEAHRALPLVRLLRQAKCDVNDKRVPDHTEIALVPYSPNPAEICTQYAGLFVFSESARLVRPVMNLRHKHIELVGTFEQVYMSICIDASEATEGVTEHQELNTSSLFSFAANLIPMPDHNQSPRNVYQCQMGKQTMGFPIYNWVSRADNKMYKLLYPQKPVFKTVANDKYAMDEYPLGTNGIVAVCSYTGYDMEDAMVINKGSYERGFAWGHVFKCERINLRETGGSTEFFLRDPAKVGELSAHMSEDGTPICGQLYNEGDPCYCVFDPDSRKFNVKYYHNSEPAYASQVRGVGTVNNAEPFTHLLILWRIGRNPIIGDKFASRHGQKGINSFLWPAANMPFSESGMVPDILFNPHGFPSRMTIGMMIESMAGKAAASHAWTLDATPFAFGEDRPAIEYYGDLLTKAGYNYLGREPMYSGITGKQFEVDIFFGVIYYQRLRHMIADKFQVRATGPVDQTTHQPVKGRKRAGGIRFGEMERDALIAHGCSFALRDRLFNSSDRDTAHICVQCGSMVSCHSPGDGSKVRCRVCHTSDTVRSIAVPYVFRYLAAELISMNIKPVVRLGQAGNRTLHETNSIDKHKTVLRSKHN